MTVAKRRFDNLVLQIGKNIEQSLPPEYAGRVGEYISQQFETVTLSGKGLLEILFAQQTFNLALIEALVPLLDDRKDDARERMSGLVQEVRGQSEAFSEVISKALTAGLSAYISGEDKA